MTIQFNVTGVERKKLVGAISQELNLPTNYLGAPTFAYEIGEYRVDKTGTVTGPDNRDLIDALTEPHGFVALIGEYDDDPADETPDTAPATPDAPPVPAFEDLQLTEREELGLGRERRDPVGEDGPQPSDVPEPGNSDLHQTEEWAEGQPDIDTLSIDLPLEGFTPEVIDNLCKLVGSKEVLIKKALGAEALPIQVLEDRVSFPWLKANTESDHIIAYAAFITHLAETAKSKKRVTAKAQESFENEKFAMRVWLIGLGLIGKEFNLTRKLLMANLGGNSSWRYGAPDKAAAAEELAPAPADTAPAEEPATAPSEAATGEEPAPTDTEPVEDEAGQNSLAETLADAALIHAVNESFDNGGDTEEHSHE